jgi:uncharacterized protein
MHMLFHLSIMNANFSQHNAGRIFLSPLSKGEDILRAVEDFCQKNAIKLAAFSVTGAVSLFTIGVFDQKQLVHVTSRHEFPMEIICCTGNITLHGENAHVQAQIILADQLGKTSGGRLFSDTLLFSGELQLMELLGPPVSREYDQDSGRMQWNVNKLKNNGL